MRRVHAFALLCWMLIGLAGPSFAELGSDAIREAFLVERVQGTMIIESLDGSVTVIHNEDRAAARFSPASTFKIVNTLIALDQGIIASRHSTFTWDGVERGVPAWNQDQTLASAFAVSCVWCYQQIARRVGTGVYLSELDRLEYGNGLVHISQISNERVEKVSDKLAEGDVVKVKVLEVDRQGRVRLSMKEVDAA